MTKDLNKGISHITYNCLNLPQQMDIKSPLAEARNEYTYTASGAKLRVVSKWNTNFSTNPLIGSDVSPSLLTKSKTSDYVGNKVYENGVLKRILIDGGYIENGLYHFYLTDHLGNNRTVAKSDGSIVQRTQYYPFGMAFADGLAAGIQPYKFGSKELDAEHGLMMYDYSARYYNGISFTSIDPLAEKYYSISPYVYCANNPIRYVDPTGMVLDDFRLDKEGNLHLIKKTDATNHTIYATNSKGGIDKNNSIDVDKSFIDKRETILGARTIASDGSKNKADINIYASLGDNRTTQIFEFFAKNSNVEWSQTKTTYNNKEVNYITTANWDGGEPGQSLISARIITQNNKMSAYNSVLGKQGTQIREVNHNHPNGNSIVSVADVNVASIIQSKFPTSKFHNYTREFGYTPYNMFTEPAVLPAFTIYGKRK